MNEPGRRPRHSDEPVSPLQRFLPVLAGVWLIIFWLMFFSQDLPNNPSVSRLVVVQLLPEIYSAMISPEPTTGMESGIRFLPQRFSTWATAAFLCAAAIAIGRWILRLTGVSSMLTRAERFALAGGLGFSAVSLFTLGCGLAGWLSRPLFLAFLGGALMADLAVSMLAWVRSRKAAPATRSSPATPPIAPAPRWIRWGCIAVATPFLLAILFGASLPPTDFDVREYHLQGPKEYLLAGRIQFLPHNVYTSFPFLTEMLSLTAMVVRQDWFSGALAGQVVLAAFAPLTAVGLFCIGRRCFDSTTGWLAALVSLTTPWTYRISIIAYTEGAMCAYVALTLLAFLIWKQQAITPLAEGVERSRPTMPRRWAFLFGVLAGSAIATKYPGLVFVGIPFGLGILGVWAFHRQTIPLRVGLASALLYAAGVLVAFGPWMAKNIAETGNPVYPLAYSLFGGRDWSPEMNEKWKRAHSPPANRFANLTEDLAGVAIRNDWQSPLLFGLAPLAFFHRRRRTILGFMAYSVLILAIWFLFTHRIDRFWTPVIPVLSILSGCALAAVVASPVRPRSQKPNNAPAVDRFPVPRFTRLVTLCLTAFAVIFNLGLITTGLGGNNAYLKDINIARKEFLPLSLANLESYRLKETPTVLFVGEAEVFDATYPHRYNTVFDVNLLEDWSSVPDGSGGWTLLPAQQILDRLRAEGITHVLVNWNEILRYRTTYGFTDFVSPTRIQELVDLGVLVPVRMRWPESYVPWEGLAPSWAAEVERWGPQLRTSTRGRDVITAFQLFRIPDALTPPSKRKED